MSEELSLDERVHNQILSNLAGYLQEAGFKVILIKADWSEHVAIRWVGDGLYPSIRCRFQKKSDSFLKPTETEQTLREKAFISLDIVCEKTKIFKWKKDSGFDYDAIVEYIKENIEKNDAKHIQRGETDEACKKCDAESKRLRDIFRLKTYHEIHKTSRETPSELYTLQFDNLPHDKLVEILTIMAASELGVSPKENQS